VPSTMIDVTVIGKLFERSGRTGCSIYLAKLSAFAAFGGFLYGCVAHSRSASYCSQNSAS
jgi:hypothetical protein